MRRKRELIAEWETLNDEDERALALSRGEIERGAHELRVDERKAEIERARREIAERLAREGFTEADIP